MMAAKTSSPASAFAKVLRSFETGGFTYREVVAELKRLLKGGASPTELSEILRRRESVEPLPTDAHKEVLGLLDAAKERAAANERAAAKERAAAEAIDRSAETAGAYTPPPPKPAAVPDEKSASHPAKERTTTERIPSIAPGATRTEGVYKTIRIVPPPRIPDRMPTPEPKMPELKTPESKTPESKTPEQKTPEQKTPEQKTPELTAPELDTSESKLVTVPVQVPARTTHDWTPAWHSLTAIVAPKRSPTGDGHANVVARAITLARKAASPARTSAPALPNSGQRNTGRIAPAVQPVSDTTETSVPTPSRRAATAPVSTPAAAAPGAPTSGKASVAAPARGPAPISTPVPPAEEPVMEGNPAQSGLREQDDWSDLVISQEDLTPDSVAAGREPKGRGVSRGWMARVIGLCAAALLLAAVAWFWFYLRHAPMPAGAAVPPPEAAPTPGTLIRDCPTCAAMIVLPAARFKQGIAATDRGSSFEKPQRSVNIVRPFAMSANLVTVEEYRQFIDATGRAMQGCETYDGSWSRRADHNWQNPGFAQSGLHPVTCVSWNDAAAYAQWLSARTGHVYRLPSASEWEYAARAGGEAVYPWANGSNACAFANVADASAARRYPGWAAFACDDGYANTSPVGSFKANPLGLNDMLGNVLQWTEDCWHADYRGAPADGSARADGDCSERELRGSSWFTPPSYVRATYRNHFAADYRTSSVGIRLARDVGS